MIDTYRDWSKGLGGISATTLVRGLMSPPGTPDADALAACWKLDRAERLQSRNRALPRQMTTIALIVDALVILAALIGSYWVRFVGPLSSSGVLVRPGLDAYAAYFALGTLSLVTTMALLDVYERGNVLRYRFVAQQILKASVLWISVFLALSTLIRFSPDVSRLYIAVAAFIVPATLLVWRAAFMGLLLNSSAALSLRQRVLFVGWNGQTARLARTLSGSGSAYQVVGWVESGGASAQERTGVRLVGHAKDVEEIIPKLGIDVVILTASDLPRDGTIRLANTCDRELAQFKVVPSQFQILLSGLHLETIKGVPVLGVSRLPLDRLHNVLLKRLVDIVGALVGLTLSLPIMAIFGALVWWESPGPVLYRQRRWGRAGAPFDIFKIRSMRLNAEAGGKVGWSTKDDPRRLRIGGFMRRWNIDEVPQFWNVLKGEMSLVGPRPERPELIRNFKHEIPHYNARHNAKPGITGWAQVKGFRGDTDLTARIQCDLWYLENWSLLLDLQIMFMTFLRNKNAC